MISKLRSIAAVAVLGIGAAIGAPSAHANLVQNGGFENVSALPTPNGAALTDNGYGLIGTNTTVANWTSTGSNYVFNSSNVSTGVPNNIFGIQLSAPGDGSANGLGSSPNGGNFIAADGASNQGPITQTVTGLITGRTYTVGFYYAAAEQLGFNAPTHSQWDVSFGGQSQSTQVLNIAGEGFSGWQYASLTFTASGTSDVLSFLAVGTPSGEPPFSLLDGVDVEVPEPSSAAIFLMGIIGVESARRLRRKSGSTAMDDFAC
jgi:hypothetical protein